MVGDGANDCVKKLIKLYSLQYPKLKLEYHLVNLMHHIQHHFHQKAHL